MAETQKARLLKAEEIECRVALVKETGLSLLLFMDARAGQKILDEVYTPFGWKRSHQSIDGILYCTLEVWDGEKEQWVGKQDVGTMSEYEKEKGQASDSFKRACYNWGIGRELYTAPFIWITAERAGLQRKGDRLVFQERFSVRSVSYNSRREISSLEIADSHGQTVYCMGKGQNQDRGQEQLQEKTQKQLQEETQGQEKKQTREKKQTQGQKAARGMQAQEQEGGINDASKVRLMAELGRTGVALGDVLSRYGIADIEQMTPDIYNKAMGALRRSKTRAA